MKRVLQGVSTSSSFYVLHGRRPQFAFFVSVKNILLVLFTHHFKAVFRSFFFFFFFSFFFFAVQRVESGEASCQVP